LHAEAPHRRKAEAFDTLKKAFAAGSGNGFWAAKDSELACLRDDPEFRKMVGPDDSAASWSFPPSCLRVPRYAPAVAPSRERGVGYLFATHFGMNDWKHGRGAIR
jgi:hypothetical protein